MAGNFNITAQIHLQAPNAKQFSRNLQKQLQNPNIKVNLQGAPKTVKDLNNVVKATRDVEKASRRAGKGADYMGRQLGSAFKQIMKYDIARRVFSLFANSIEQGVRDAIAFERAMVRVAQVSGASAREMKALTTEITKVAKQFGVSSQVLAKTSLILKQTGLSMRDTKIAMEALAKTELAPTFDNIADTAEMAVAAMRQFGMEASKLESLLGKINVVAGNFAVESSDIGVAIRRAGGAFKSAGGQVEELIALFTSVRATTRETAETIATGFRTIFTRLQRPSTIKFLRQFGIELTDLNGKFIGPYKAVERLHGALKGLSPQDLRYSAIVEQLGGFRQVSKVIPLIQQFGTAQAALNAQQAESGSLASDAAKAQATLAVQMQKLTEQVKELFREIVGSDSFQMMAKGALALAEGIVKVGKALAPVIPLITAMAGMKMAGWAMGSMKMMGGRGLMASTGSMGGTGGPGFFNRGGRVRRFSRGGWVPGSGNGDTVPAMLEPGEFVLRKSAAQAFGPQLASVNRYAPGGQISSGPSAISRHHSAMSDMYSSPYPKRHDKRKNTAWNMKVHQFTPDDKLGINNKHHSLKITEKTLRKHPALVQAWRTSSDTDKGTIWEQILAATQSRWSGKDLAGGAIDGSWNGKPADAATSTSAHPTAQMVAKGLKLAGESVLKSAGIRSTADSINTGIELTEVMPNQSTVSLLDSMQFNKGGLVPSLLTPGEFVVNKRSAQKIGYNKLAGMNRFSNGGAVGGGVLPTGFGGGGFNAGGMMMQLGMMEGMFGKVAQSGLGAFNGLTNVATGATMAYTKFAMVTQSVGAAAQMFGIQSEALTDFINRLSMVGGVLSSFASVMQNPAAQQAMSRATDLAINGLMLFGGKLKSLGKAIGGKLGDKVASSGSRMVGSVAGRAKDVKTSYGQLHAGMFRRPQLKRIQAKAGKLEQRELGKQAYATKAKGHVDKNVTGLEKNISASKAESAKINAKIAKNQKDILKSTNDIARAERDYKVLADARARNEVSRIAANKRVAEIGEGFPKLLKKEKHAYETGLKIQEKLNAARTRLSESGAKFAEGQADFKAGKYIKDGGTAGESSMKRSGKGKMEYWGRQASLDQAEVKKLEEAMSANAKRQASYTKRIADAEDTVDKLTDVQRNMIKKNQALDGALDKTLSVRGKASTGLAAQRKVGSELAEQGVKAGTRTAQLAKKLAGAKNASAKYAKQIKDAGNAAAKFKQAGKMGGKLLLKGSRAFATLGASIVIEETLGAIGREIKGRAMDRIEEDGARMTEAEGDAAVTQASAGGALSTGVMVGAISMLLIPIFGPLAPVIGFLVGGLYGWFKSAEEAREALERAKFAHAAKNMSEAMDKFGKGLVTASYAVARIAEMQAINKSIQEGDYGVSGAELAGNRAQMQENAVAIVRRQATEAKSGEDFKNDPAVKRLMAMGLVTEKLYDESVELAEANQKARKEMELYLEAQKASNKEMRKLAGAISAISEMSNRLSTFGSQIENIASPGSGAVGKTSDLFKNAGDSKKATEDFEKAIDMFGNVAGGDSLSQFGEKAKDAQFVNANIEDILIRSGMAGGLDAENMQQIIMDDIDRTAKGEGHELGKYMRDRLQNMIGSLSEEDLSDLENNAGEIAEKIQADQEKFLEVFKNAAELLDQYTSELKAAYDAQLKLEQEYVQRQQSLMNARFASDENFRQNLSASAFSGTSNADVQSNFLANQQMLVSGSGGIGGMSAARQASLTAAGGVGDVNAVGATFRQISEDLRANQQQLIQQGLDPAALEDTGAAGGLADEQQRLIEKNKELRGEYEAAKKVLENYANSQERLTALNRELEQAQNKRKSLKDLAVQARYGTAEEKDQAARLINAITIASQQGIDAVAPELQRQVVGYLPQLMGAQGESMVDQGINDAFGGGQGIAGITEVSAEERRLATEIKAIEDAGITAGEHLAEEVGDRIGDMADKIAELNKNFVIDLRSLFLEQESKQAKADIATAEAEIKGADKNQKLLEDFGIKGTMDAEGNISYSESDQAQLNALREVAGAATAMTQIEEARGAVGDINLADARTKLGGGKHMFDELATGTGAGLYTALGITKEQFNAAMGGGAEGEGMMAGDNYNVGGTFWYDSDQKALDEVVSKLKSKLAEMGADDAQLIAFEKQYQDLLTKAEDETMEGQDILGPLFNVLARKQQDAKEELARLEADMEESGVSSEVIEKMKGMTPKERKEYAERATKASSIGDLETFANERNQSYKDLAEAKESLKTVKDKTAKLSDEATKRGSIFTHDIYLERILLNILTVLEGEGRSVDLLPTNLNPLAPAGGGGKGAAPGFMKAFGGSSLTDLANMGDEEKQKMLSMLSKDGSISSAMKADITGAAGGLPSMFAADKMLSSPLTDGSLEGIDMASTMKKAIDSLSEGTAAAAVTKVAQDALAEMGVNETAELFSKHIEEFSSAMGNPLSIEVGGSIEVNVNMNGADFLKNAEGALAEIAGSEASKAINNFIQQMNKSSNIKQNPQGWHQSGQPKPLTGNG